MSKRRGSTDCNSYVVVTNCKYCANALISFDANRSLDGTASPTLEKETFQRSLLAAQLANSKTNGKKAGEDAPPVNIGWDSHKPVVS